MMRRQDVGLMKNPLVHADRRLGRSSSDWVSSFSCEDMGVLIVCRGPIRKEAIDVFREMGITRVGILLSEKDSIVYPRALAPEIRDLDPSHVHAVPDYTGATREERQQRIAQMIEICRKHDYGYIFAGYGFMAEDEEFVRSIEQSGLKFMGPCSHTVHAAGFKDEAKRTALENDVSVTPGVNDVTVRTLVHKAGDEAGLRAIAEKHGIDTAALSDGSRSFAQKAEAILTASYAKQIDLFTIDELGDQVEREVATMLAEFAGSRVRLKAIGGGGGKGQRILSDPSKARSLVHEILNEVKATGVGDNKNVLIELNVEQTRHNEIQLIGNGEWCISLGGRDCSLQMHEQKLLEVSVTQEMLRQEITASKTAGLRAREKALEEDLATLMRMEDEAERFGVAVKLDSASTFECIVSGPRHFFMEVNTRIQVEHRVSELCYALRFRNPEQPSDYFDVDSLVEMMALLAHHKERLPRPERVLREGAAVEARLNATNRALRPHAGGEIMSWSNPIPCEIRDDQGISRKNPDTGLFMRYRLAGAYDSNIALLVTTGDSRRHSYENLAEILRCTELRGPDLATNLEFHFGLTHFFLSYDVMAKPTTAFVVPYLTLVGLLKDEANRIDLDYAYAAIEKRALASLTGDAKKAAREIFDIKRTLITRPLEKLFAEPHHLSAWLSNFRRDFEIVDGRVRYSKNPVQILAETYQLLRMEARPGAPAAVAIWDHDEEVLSEAMSFYAKLRLHDTGRPYHELAADLESVTPKLGFDAETWPKVRAAHQGFQLGLELLSVLPFLGARAGFYELRVEDDLTCTIPERLRDAELTAKMAKVLVPPLPMKDDEIVAETGGMFYAQESPGAPALAPVGHHFEKGDPLYVLEVMKMFNKVLAPFSGTIDEMCVSGGEGMIVSKGQTLFKVTPDEKLVVEDPAVVAARTRESTDAILASILG
jgi:acetyl/propionyl-CoA carboxylase alpha subunit